MRNSGFRAVPQVNISYQSVKSESSRGPWKAGIDNVKRENLIVSTERHLYGVVLCKEGWYLTFERHVAKTRLVQRFLAGHARQPSC
jgi:hypothetical protein